MSSETMELQMDSLVLHREIMRTLQTLDEVQWPPTQNVIWFDSISSDIPNNFTMLVNDASMDGFYCNSSKTVLKLLTYYSKLKIIGEVCYKVRQSHTLPLWEKDVLNYWPLPVRRVTTVCIPPPSFSKQHQLPIDYLNTAVEEVVSKVDELWRDDSLILHGFPLYFELDVYVLFLIGKLFKKVGLVRPHASDEITILLFMFKRWDISTKKSLKQVLTDTNGLDPTQLFISGDNQFFESKFYTTAVDMSSIHLKEMVLDMMDVVSRARLDLIVGKSVVPAARCEAKTVIKRGKQSLLQTNKEEHCPLISISEELELAEIFLKRLDLPQPVNNAGVSWLQFPKEKIPPLSFIRKPFLKPDSFEMVHVSKFCSTPLLRCHLRLSSMVNENSSIQVALLSGSLAGKYPWWDVFLDAYVLDFGVTSWFDLEHYIESQRSMLKSILSYVFSMQTNDSMILKCYPMMSEFNVSVVFLLSFIFEKIGMLIPDEDVKDTIILFHNFHHFDERLKQHLENAVEEEGLLSLVSLNNIYDAQVYGVIKSVNNLCLKLQSITSLLYLRKK